MKNLLIKLKLIDYLNTELKISKSEFLRKLNLIVDEGSTNSLTDIFDVFSSSKNEYKGKVDFSKFEIKRKRKFFDINFNFPLAKGTVNQKGELLYINTEINAFKGLIVFFFIILLIFYSIFLITLIFGGINEGKESLIIIPFILIHGSLMLGMPYLFLRKSVERFKYNFERELFYLTKET